MSAFPQHLDRPWAQSIRRQLLHWYRRNARSLPWRESADPYFVWISEIMLQQTTIAAVYLTKEQPVGRTPNSNC